MSKRYAFAKKDGNHNAICGYWRSVGASVHETHMLGEGFPDAVVGWKDKDGVPRTYLAEIKDGSLPPSRRALTPSEQKWHDNWQGHKCIIETMEDAMRLLGFEVI